MLLKYNFWEENRNSQIKRNSIALIHKKHARVNKKWCMMENWKLKNKKDLIKNLSKNYKNENFKLITNL